MRSRPIIGSVEAVRRKLQALTAVAADVGATQHERANAEALKIRLQQQLAKIGMPAGDWTDGAFRLGRWARELGKSTAPTAPKGDWTDNAFRLGKGLRRSYKRWSSE
jgi:hypothetical protein